MTAMLVEKSLQRARRVPSEMFPYLRENLLFEDDEPIESEDHRDFMIYLIQLVRDTRGTPVDYYVSGNSAVYFSPEQIKNQDFKAPDFVFINDVDGSKYRDGWVVWEENYRYPDLILELLSPSTRNTDLGKKKDLYEQVLQTPEYFICDPTRSNSLKGWRLQNGVYKSIPAEKDGRLWSEQLALYFGYWEGAISNKWRDWLRFFDSNGNLVLLAAEKARKQLEQTQQDITRIQKQIEQARQDAVRAKIETKQAQQENTRIQKQVEQARQDAVRAKIETKRAQQQIIRIEKQVEQAQEEIKRARQEANRAEWQAVKKTYKTKLRTAIQMKRKGADIDFIVSVLELDKEYLHRFMQKIF